MRSKETFDVLLVGGGPTSLAAGILLRKRGMTVAMVEGFPWEWWLSDDEDESSFLNFSGGLLYGVPGYHPVTSLMIELGIPLNNPGGEGLVSFKTLEPGFQALLPRRWVNVITGEGELARELERVFPNRGSDLAPLLAKAREYQVKQEHYWSSTLAAPRREPGGSPMTSFLDGWAGYWTALFGKGVPTAERVIASVGKDSPLVPFLRLMTLGLARKVAADAGPADIFGLLEMTAAPSCIINETGQRGMIHALRSSLHKSGGTIYRADAAVGLEGGDRHGAHLTIGERRSLAARWVLLDGPEAELAALLDRRVEGVEAPVGRQCLHCSLPVSWSSLPAGMGGHLVFDPDGAPDPLIVTIAPGTGDLALLEMVAPIAAGAVPDAAAAARQVERLRLLLRFLPDDLPEPYWRVGSLPSHHGGAGLLDRLRHPGPALTGTNLLQKGPYLLTGRGDYLGSALNGALGDGRELALWILHHHR